MSKKPSSTEKKKLKKRVPKVDTQETVDTTQSTQPSADSYPANQQALNMPDVDKKTVEGVEKLMELSYLGYLRELRKTDLKDNVQNIERLNAILSEYVGPYMLIGYLPDNEPIEIMYAPTAKDKEAVIERLRKTFIRHMNANTPG